MAFPQIKGYQIADQTVTKDDLNTKVTGKAVITRILEESNSGIKLYSSTGADSGTGEVKLMVDTNYLDGIYLRSETNPYVSNITASIGDAGNLTLTRVNASNISTNIYSLKVADVRSASQVPGSDGSTGYWPDPNDTYFDQGVHAHFNMGWNGGTGWGTSLILKGWNGDYGVWAISGPTAHASAPDDFYLRSGWGTTWNTPVRIWHSGDYDIDDYALTTSLFSGSYNDLTDKPTTIPPAENSTGKFYATPPYPASGTPGFRTIASVDLPSLPISKLSQDSPSTYIPVAYLGSGTPDSSHYLRGDGTWATISTGSNQDLQSVTDLGDTTTHTITAAAFYESSSRKLKDNIKTYTENCTKLLKLVTVKEFDFKATGTHHIGIIAEEVPKPFSPTGKQFDIASSLAILIKGFQELEERISKLEK